MYGSIPAWALLSPTHPSSLKGKVLERLITRKVVESCTANSKQWFMTAFFWASPDKCGYEPLLRVRDGPQCGRGTQQGSSQNGSQVPPKMLTPFDPAAFVEHGLTVNPCSAQAAGSTLRRNVSAPRIFGQMGAMQNAAGPKINALQWHVSGCCFGIPVAEASQQLKDRRMVFVAGSVLANWRPRGELQRQMKLKPRQLGSLPPA